ncbi:uncharacterized protein LOC133032241 [Cannabis sativa]|uniref:uncharacterized protein LOC133032241 n=1 Tax=Cannabis sativa TaxID=3483 RepID=UPI0029C9DEA7|nr:uncharacterized protein LOC133032241 [Cannabis sativa]
MISGPQQSGHNIDVYLELYENGIQAYDGFKKEFFNLKAVLLWTDIDFPAYSNLAGLSTKGYEGCPICCTNTSARRLANGHKMCYMGHRRYLPANHPDRRKKKALDGTEEGDMAPLPLSREQNVMHIEKNVCESIIGTLLDIPGKNGLNSRLDLVEMGIRQSLAPEKKDERLYLPPACFTLSKKEKQIVCKSLANMKVPDGYSSYIKNLVNEIGLKLMGLKSHDCHALMQHLLPISIRSVLPKNVQECLTHVCIFFNKLCGKELELDKLDALHEHVVKTLCHLEKFFPPSFFDIMIHLMVHLVREARMCGPVWARWMYPFERNMKVLKSYVRNHSRPEACMVECYISEEVVEFCSEYIVEAIGISKPRTKPYEVDRGLRGKGTMVTVSKLELDQAQLVVMNNNAEVQPYITNTIIAKLNEPNHGVSDVLSRIALGPTFAVAKHEAYIVKGKRFHTKSRDDA